jgi:D-3-phosphoglycerate dehydrogenase
MRHVSRSIRHVNEGNWNRDLFEGRELYNKTVGIVGYGRLGRRVAKYLLAFDVKVLATGPALKQSDVDAGITVVPLPELLEKCDIVSLHADYTSDNDRFFGTEQFKAMKAGALFINTARGELVDEPALLASLESGHLAGAALDVLRDETSVSVIDNLLVKYAQSHDNLLITPHIGGNTRESLNKTEYFLANNRFVFRDEIGDFRELCRRLRRLFFVQIEP